jgi:dipeptidyl aminopeptidase/acylaminoacyl peptidase
VYIAGTGVVYVYDTLTSTRINTIEVGTGKNITSLASSGNLLIIGEGTNTSGSGAGGFSLYVMDINPGSKNYNKPVSLKNTGIEQTRNGVTGLAIGPDGKTLVVAAAKAPDSVMLAAIKEENRGDVWVFDLRKL